MTHCCSNADVHQFFAFGLDRSGYVYVIIVVVIVLKFYSFVVGLRVAHLAPVALHDQVGIAEYPFCAVVALSKLVKRYGKTFSVYVVARFDSVGNRLLFPAVFRGGYAFWLFDVELNIVL